MTSSGSKGTRAANAPSCSPGEDEWPSTHGYCVPEDLRVFNTGVLSGPDLLKRDAPPLRRVYMANSFFFPFAFLILREAGLSTLLIGTIAAIRPFIGIVQPPPLHHFLKSTDHQV